MPEANLISVNNFDINHQAYDTFRPSFKDEIVNPFLEKLGLAKYNESSSDYTYDLSKVILEVAAGTGKFTRNLVNHGWGSKDNLIAVEPSKGMLETFQKNFPNIPKQNIHNSSSYNLPLSDNSVDSIVIAQGFHWFADEASLKELHRVLKPNGTLGLIWNGDCSSKVQDVSIDKTKFYNSDSTYYSEFIKNNSYSSAFDLFEDYFNKQPWSKNTADYIYTFDDEVPQYRKIDWKLVLQSKENPYFSAPEEEEFLLYDIELEKNQVYSYWATRSYITNLSSEKRKEVETTINDLVKKYVKEDSYTSNGYLLKPMLTHSIVLQSKKL